MSKQILCKDLRYINFSENRFLFYRIEVFSVGYNKMKITVSEGKVGTKGKSKETAFEGKEDVFKQTLKVAYNWIYEKKNEGYLSLEKLKTAFSQKPPFISNKKKNNEPIELIRLDFDDNDYRFYHLESLSIGHNDMQIIASHGKLGSNGRSQVKRFEGDDQSFSKSIHFRNQKVHEKKGEGYITKEQACSILVALSEREGKPKQKKATALKKKIAFGYDCDKCAKTIPPSTYDKINAWARGKGNWDAHPIHAKKIYCLDCQFDLDIFQKRLEPK